MSYSTAFPMGWICSFARNAVLSELEQQYADHSATYPRRSGQAMRRPLICSLEWGMADPRF